MCLLPSWAIVVGSAVHGDARVHRHRELRDGRRMDPEPRGLRVEDRVTVTPAE